MFEGNPGGLPFLLLVITVRRFGRAAAGPALCWVTGEGTYLTADPAHHTRVYATGYGPGTPWLDAVLAGIDTPAAETMPLHAPAGRPLIGLLRAAAAAGHTDLLIHQTPGRFTLAVPRRD